MISERIAVQFAGISMKTPVMGASGTFGFGVEYSDFLDLDHVGAIISKGITPLPRPGNPGVRVAETPAGMLNCIGLENPGVEVFKRDILPKVHQACQTPLIVNISAGTAEEWLPWKSIFPVLTSKKGASSSGPSRKRLRL